MIDLTQRKPTVGLTTYPVQINALIDDVQIASSLPVAPFGHKPSTTAGLTWGYYGGQRWISGVLTTVADSTLLLTASVTNYVEYTDAGVVSCNSAGFSADKNPIAEITTGVGAITAVLDRRSQRDPATGRLSKSVAGGVDVTLTAAEARADIIEFTGLLTGGINVILPTRAWCRLFANTTTGAFALTVKTAAGTGKTITQGKRAILYCDATNVLSSFDDGNLIGTSSPFSDATAIVAAAADATRLLKLIAGGIATATTRSAFVADEDSTIGVDWSPKNVSIVCSHSGNAETIALKDRAGNDFSATNPLILKFRNVTAGTGDYTTIPITAAFSITIPSTATLGASNGVLFRIWLVVFNDGGTPRLGVVRVTAGTAPSITIMALKDDDLNSSTLTPANSAQVIYTTGSAVTAKAMRLLGYLEYTLATAGTWVTAPSKIQLFGPGVPMPGAVVQEQCNGTGAFTSTATNMLLNNTTPTNTAGAQVMSQAITPTSSANVLDTTASGMYSREGGTADIAMQVIYQDSSAGLATSGVFVSNSVPANAITHYRAFAGQVTSLTMKIRAGTAAGTMDFNGGAGGQYFNGTSASYVSVKELMG